MSTSATPRSSVVVGLPVAGRGSSHRGPPPSRPLWTACPFRRIHRSRFGHLHLLFLTRSAAAIAAPDGVAVKFTASLVRARGGRGGGSWWCRSRGGRLRIRAGRPGTSAALGAWRRGWSRSARRRLRRRRPGVGQWLRACSVTPVPGSARSSAGGVRIAISTAPAISAAVPAGLTPPERPVARTLPVRIERGGLAARVPISVAHVSAVAAA